MKCGCPSVLWHCWLGGRKGIRPVKNWAVGCWYGICLEQGADLHMARLMPLPLTFACISASGHWTELCSKVSATSRPHFITHTHPFNGPLSGTTRVSQYQKGKTNLDYPAWITTVESTQVALYNTSPMPVPSLLNLHASINGLLTDSKAKSTKLAMATQPTNSIYKHGDRCWMLWVQAAGRGTAITTDINSDNTEGEVTSHNLCLR